MHDKSEVDRVKFCCCGIGGYAGVIIDQLLLADDRGTATLSAVCDPQLSAHAQRVEKLAERGVRAYESLERMLAAEPAGEAVWLPLPIHLHRPFAEQCLTAGRHVVTEKPAAGSVQDVKAMIAARDASGKKLFVGFQDIYADSTVPVKEALLSGAIGKVTTVSVSASWPRDLEYFSRNSWAGKLRIGDAWVLDSPLQNALSHFVNLAMFLVGPSIDAWAEPVEVEAELYRANAIENYDTCALRVKLTNDVRMSVFFTHSGRENINPILDIQGSLGRLRMNEFAYTLTGRAPRVWPADSAKLARMIDSVSAAIRGRPAQSALATLEMAQNHTVLVNSVSAAATIHTIDSKWITETASAASTLKIVPGIEDVMRRCVENHQLPSELAVPWAKPGGTTKLNGFEMFNGPAK